MIIFFEVIYFFTAKNTDNKNWDVQLIMIMILSLIILSNFHINNQ